MTSWGSSRIDARRLGFAAVAVLLVGAGCIPQPVAEKDLSVKPVSYYQQLAFDAEKSRYVAPDPYSHDVNEGRYALDPHDSWGPDDEHQLYVLFERGESGVVEGVALRAKTRSTGVTIDYPLSKGESLTYGFESEAGWPMMTITYDSGTKTVTYAVFDRSNPVPEYGLYGEISPGPRKELGKREIRFK